MARFVFEIDGLEVDGEWAAASTTAQAEEMIDGFIRERSGHIRVANAHGGGRTFIQPHLAKTLRIKPWHQPSVGTV